MRPCHRVAPFQWLTKRSTNGHRETAKVREVMDAAFDYRFNDAAQALYAYVWGKVRLVRGTVKTAVERR